MPDFKSFLKTVFSEKTETPKSPDEIKAGINKKSFELNFNGGTIWCEHLDGMGEHEREVIEKFTNDLSKLLRPSVSSSMMINLDETTITDEIAETIAKGLTECQKTFRKIAFVGADRKYHHVFSRISDKKGTVIKYMDDYEKAKEWVL